MLSAETRSCAAISWMFAKQFPNIRKILRCIFESSLALITNYELGSLDENQRVLPIKKSPVRMQKKVLKRKSEETDIVTQRYKGFKIAH